MKGKLTESLRLLASGENRALLGALAGGPSYPRALSKRLGRKETHVARRLRILERAGLVEGGWSRQDGRNVRLYRLRFRRLEFFIGADGWQTRVIDSASAIADVSQARVPERTPLYGRNAELRELSDPRVKFSMVVGLPGIGKTSLAAELAYRYGTDRVLWHSILPTDTAPSFMDDASKWLASRQIGVTTFDADRLLREVTRGLDRVQALVVLDNYDNVRDDGIQEIVGFFQRERRTGKVLILGRRRPPFDQRPGSRIVNLGGIPPEAARALLRARGIRPLAHDMRLLWRSLRGHPLALMLIGSRAPVAEGASVRVLQQLGRQAADALDSSSQGVLLALAAVRRPLDVSDLRLIVGNDDPGLSLILLERRGLVRSRGSACEAHDVLREALGPLLKTQSELHRRASAVFRRSALPEDALEAIHHAVMAGDTADAMALLEAEVLHNRHRLSDRVSIPAYLDVLDAIPTGGLSERQRFLVHLQRGTLLYEIERPAAAIREYERARRYAESVGDPFLLAAALAPLGDLFVYIGRMEDARRLLERNLKIVDAEGFDDRRARSLYSLSRFFDRAGDFDRSRRFGELALREARRRGDRDLAIDIATCPSAWAFSRSGAERWVRNEMDWIRKQGHPILLDYCRIFFGELLCRRARTSERYRVRMAQRAVTYFSEVVANWTAIHRSWTIGYVRTWRCEAYRLAGDMDNAEVEARWVLEGQREFGESHCLILGHDVLAHVFEERGDRLGAVEHARSALGVAERMHCGCIGLARLELACQLAVSQRMPEARRTLGQAVLELRERGYPDEVRYGFMEATRRGLTPPRGWLPQ